MFLAAQRTPDLVSIELILPDLRARGDERIELSYLFEITKSYALKVPKNGDIWGRSNTISGIHPYMFLV